MTREEREKALYALRKSTPIMAMTPNEFDDYIKTLNKIADWLEQEPCEGCDYKEWLKGEVEPKTDVLDKIRAEIEERETYDGIYLDRYDVLEIIDKYRESEDKE